MIDFTIIHFFLIWGIIICVASWIIVIGVWIEYRKSSLKHHLVMFIMTVLAPFVVIHLAYSHFLEVIYADH